MPSATEDKLLGGRYRLGEPLGRGGMGVVWAGRDEALGRQVAIKEVSLPVDLPADDREKLRRRTLREARAAARISSPAAVRVYDVVEEDGRPWIVMERLVARSLADVLREEGPLPPSRVAEVGLDVLGALDAAASVGVLHRDVKPANVMLRSTGRAVLTDFGIATVEGDATVTTTGLLLGSPAYMSPERARGEPSTLASDLWSLGATLYAALDGRSPFERSGSLPTLNAVLHDPAPRLVPGTELGDLIDALLAKEPARRPSPLDVRAALVGILSRPNEVPNTSGSVESGAGRDGTGQGAIESWLKPPDDRPSTTGRSQDRHVLLGLLTVAVLFAVALLGLGVYLDGWRAPESASPQAESGRGGSEAPAAVESPQPTADAAVNQPPAGGPIIGDRPSPTNQPSGPAGTSGYNAGPAAAPLPDGFQLHTDPTGFTVAVPTGWTRSVEGPRTYFKEPGGGRFLLVDQTTEPKDDPLTDWQANEPSVADRLSGYERISLDRVEYRGWNTADWEFTWDGRNGQIHVLNRNIRVSDARAYALYWSIPESQWADSRGMFDVIAQSFQPAPG